MVKKQQNKKQDNLHLWIISSAGLLIIDQLIKFFIIKKEVFFHTNIVSMNLVRNTGASFGSLQGQQTLLIWISIIVIGLFMTYFDKLPIKGLQWGIIATGGVISNLLDRIIRGAVIDYFNLHWFPVFNIADTMIVIGISILGYYLYKEDEQVKNKK